jgi:hypothetical protein
MLYGRYSTRRSITARTPPRATPQEPKASANSFVSGRSAHRGESEERLVANRPQSPALMDEQQGQHGENGEEDEDDG